MVNALIEIDDDTNRILNTVKAAHGLRDKGEAVMYITKEFAKQSYIAFDHDGRQFKPSFVKRVLEDSQSGEFVEVDLDERIAELEDRILKESRKGVSKSKKKVSSKST